MTDHQLVDATGTRRRLQALAALGHPATVIGAYLGRPRASSRALVSSWRRPGRARIHSRIADEVTRVYPQLAALSGTNPLVRINALRAGCLPPAAWDGVDIDDPDATPNTAGAQPSQPHTGAAA